MPVAIAKRINPLGWRSRCNQPLTLERLKEILHYDPDTGIWTHLKARQCVKAGTRAGRLDDSPKQGYWGMNVDGRQYGSGKLAWFYMTGEWPSRQVDHKDTNRANDRWDNLRLATNGQNKANSRLAKNNTSGFKGVTLARSGLRWEASIQHDGKKIKLGSYKDKLNAHYAYAYAASKYFGEFARPA